jgi:hypothetical protein
MELAEFANNAGLIVVNYRKMNGKILRDAKLALLFDHHGPKRTRMFRAFVQEIGHGEIAQDRFVSVHDTASGFRIQYLPCSIAELAKLGKQFAQLEEQSQQLAEQFTELAEQFTELEQQPGQLAKQRQQFQQRQRHLRQQRQSYRL